MLGLAQASLRRSKHPVSKPCRILVREGGVKSADERSRRHGHKPDVLGTLDALGAYLRYHQHQPSWIQARMKLIERIPLSEFFNGLKTPQPQPDLFCPTIRVPLRASQPDSKPPYLGANWFSISRL